MSRLYKLREFDQNILEKYTNFFNSYKFNIIKIYLGNLKNIFKF